jgi:hypothetical protein
VNFRILRDFRRRFLVDRRVSHRQTVCGFAATFTGISGVSGISGISGGRFAVACPVASCIARYLRDWRTTCQPSDSCRYFYE